MLLRCVRGFETTQAAVPLEIEQGSVWYKSGHVIVDGGYELAVLRMVDGGRFTGTVARVRLDRLTRDFEVIPDESVMPGVLKALGMAYGRGVHGRCGAVLEADGDPNVTFGHTEADMGGNDALVGRDDASDARRHGGCGHVGHGDRRRGEEDGRQ